MINGKDQEIITINKTGNSILNNAKYSADNVYGKLSVLL